MGQWWTNQNCLHVTSNVFSQWGSISPSTLHTHFHLGLFEHSQLLLGKSNVAPRTICSVNTIYQQPEERKDQTFYLWLGCSTSDDWFITQILPQTPCQFLAGNAAVITPSSQEGKHVYPVRSKFLFYLSARSGRLPYRQNFHTSAGEMAQERERETTCCTFVALNKFHVRTALGGLTDCGRMPLEWPRGVCEGTVKLGHEERRHRRIREDPGSSDASPLTAIFCLGRERPSLCCRVSKATCSLCLEPELENVYILSWERLMTLLKTAYRAC